MNKHSAQEQELHLCTSYSLLTSASAQFITLNNLHIILVIHFDFTCILWNTLGLLHGDSHVKYAHAQVYRIYDIQNFQHANTQINIQFSVKHFLWKLIILMIELSGLTKSSTRYHVQTLIQIVENIFNILVYIILS